MNIRLFCFLPLLVLSVALTSCETRTIPNAADMDHFEQQAQQMAQRQITLLDAQRSRGEISQEMYEAKVAAIQADIPKNAGKLAWTKHELAESQKRAMGIPTGSFAQQPNVPQAGFSRQHGNSSNGSNRPGGNFNSTPGFAGDGAGY